MAKAVKKKGKIRRLKRSIRKTLGALFLASALAVAAIPTEGLQAANDGIMTLADDGIPDKLFDVFGGHTGRAEGRIPYVNADATIYTYPMEEIGVTFRFAYVNPDTGDETTDTRVAVILGYTQIGNLKDGTLRIPDTMEAYKKYDLTGSTTGNAAVNMDGLFLYYKRTEQVYDADGKPLFVMGTGALGEITNSLNQVLDATGNPIPVTRDAYYPCMYSDRSTWVNDAEFYVKGDSATGGDPESYVVSTKERIGKAVVGYIGSQYLVANTEPNAKSEWKIFGPIDSPEHGIFSNETNITNLIVGEDVMGVGDYAFAGCGVRSVTFGNGLGCLGNYAFDGCGNLKEVNFDLSCSVDELGACCFRNCVSLETLNLPGNVKKLGDYAFAGCMNLKNLNLIHSEYKGSLNDLGKYVFKGCSSLTGLTFPFTYSGAVDVSEFKDCVNLSYIKTDGNVLFKLVEGYDSGFKFKEFKETVLKAFYLEGPKTAALHTVATEQRIAYKFLDPDLNIDVYEVIVGEVGKDGVLYWVNEEGRIVKCDMVDKDGKENPALKLTTVVLPEVIGPKNIVGVDSGTFSNKCFLKTITIPASVTYIAEDAFKGSHSLQNVIFTNAENITSIGRGAFYTQEAISHMEGCPVRDNPAALAKESDLHFIGTISSTCKPFTYAMTPSEYINTGSQYRTYITYYSGWPANLIVRYNEVTDSNELIDYPTIADFSGNKYFEKDSDGDYKYAYMTDELKSEVSGAVSAYSSGSMTDYQRQLIDAALNLVLPDGIESIASVNPATGEPVKDASTVGSVSGSDAESGAQGLFAYKEQADMPLRDGEKTLTTEGLTTIFEGAFRGCNTFTGVTFNGPLKSVGNYAFEDCVNLTNVSISESTSVMGLRPFTGCTSLSDVNFNGSEHFNCDNSIVFELDGSGNKAKIVEYLCARRSGSVKADDLAGVTGIYPEAFMNTGVKTVDLSQTGIIDVPENAFRETAELFSVVLPNTCKSISMDAFTDSSIYELTIPRSVQVISNDAFRNIKGGIYEDMTDTTSGHLIFYCADDSVAALYADKYNPPIDHEPYKDPIYYKVTFFDWDGTVLEETHVEEGTAAECSVTPSREGYIFMGWNPPVDCVLENITTTAIYEIIDPETLKVTVRFIERWPDEEPKIHKEVRVEIGGSVDLPRDPYRAGYIFVGWQGTYENVQKDEDVYAFFEKLDENSTMHTVRFLDWDETVLAIQRVQDGTDAVIPKDPVRAGYTFDKWLPTPTNVTRDLDVWATYTGDGTGSTDPNNPNNPGSNGGNGTSSGNGSDGSSSKLYTLTVQNGSGSGSYVAGSQPIIIANDPSSTQEFSHWTIDPENTTIASKTLSATVITMPEGNVTVTAHYRAKTGSGSGSGSSSSANSGGRPNNGALSSGGTTVVIDKNGLSNTGVVAATVNGSSDNFVIKITESSAATEAVVRALMAEYGSLDNIKYFPMDISLYDSTGTTKITDTTGLSVDITLPIPDSLITYAGNNKVAGVVNDRLDKLSAKFTTISGVSCITFRAEHFSPYVIYVDTANLSAGGSSDSTPKTGDGIHPKWFLSIGLACLSFVMFMQKDKKKPQKAKVKARA